MNAKERLKEALSVLAAPGAKTRSRSWRLRRSGASLLWPGEADKSGPAFSVTSVAIGSHLAQGLGALTFGGFTADPL